MLDLEPEREVEIKDNSKVFGVVTRRMELPLTRNGAVWWSKIRSSVLDILTLRSLVDVQVEVSGGHMD